MDYSSILKYAMQMELEGYNFFKEKAEKFSNPTSKALFEELAEVEMEHYELLKEQLDSYEKTKGFKDISKELDVNSREIFKKREKSEHLNATLQESDIPDLTILRMAYLIEKDYAEFYRKAAERADDGRAKKIFEILAQWEDSHEKLFKEEYGRRMQEYMNLPWGG